MKRLGPKVGGHLAPCCTHRVNHGELSQCFKHDDSTINIVEVLLLLLLLLLTYLLTYLIIGCLCAIVSVVCTNQCHRRSTRLDRDDSYELPRHCVDTQPMTTHCRYSVGYQAKSVPSRCRNAGLYRDQIVCTHSKTHLHKTQPLNHTGALYEYRSCSTCT